MRNSRIIRLLLALNALVLLAWVGLGWWNRRQIEDRRHALREMSLSTYDQIGALAKEDGWRLRRIGDRVQSEGTLSEEELAYCLAMFDRGPKVDNELAWDTLAIEASVPISYARSLSPSQYEKVEAFAERMIAKRTKTCQASALIMLRRCRAPNRMKFYNNLLKSDVTGVGAVAQRMIDAEKKESLHAS